MKFWLLKSEPNEYSWRQMEKDVVVPWDDVRNCQAQNYMRDMRVGDLAFFYHTGREKAIFGIIEIVKGYYCDENPKVDIKIVRPLESQVTLQDIKLNPILQNMVILRQPRLSISPVSEAEWNEIVKC